MLSILYNVKGLDFFCLVGNCKCSVWDRAHGTVNSQPAVKNKRIKVHKQADNLRRYYWKLAVKEIAQVVYFTRCQQPQDTYMTITIQWQ